MVEVTRWVMLLTTVGLVGYNIGVWLVHGGEATISNQIHSAVRQWPSIALAVGVLIGHWLWPARAEAPWWWVFAVVGGVGAVVLVDVLFGIGRAVNAAWELTLFAVFAVGLLVGRYFWANSGRSRRKVDTRGNKE